MQQRKFIFIRDYDTQLGTIKSGSELVLFRGFFYLNGGMLAPGYEKMFTDIIEQDSKNHFYLQEVKVIGNKL